MLTSKQGQGFRCREREEIGQSRGRRVFVVPTLELHLWY